MGFAAEPDQVVTSGQATGWYLEKKKPGATIFVVGTDSLKTELAAFNLKIAERSAETADYVVVGFDTELSYDKLRTACVLLCGGAGFIGTNPDLVCPVGAGRYIPDCGSICAMLENAVKRQPVYIGKPHTIMIDYIRSRREISSEGLAMVGDRLYTDIALGCNASIMSVCVLSGETDRKAVAKSAYLPDIVVESVAELGCCLM
jgi:HAD superfamily hydrolase (TIGR01450 family)